jgi:hypothetical protein
MFIWLIIRLFQLVFLVGTVFFSHNKLANNIFQPAYQPNRTGPWCWEWGGGAGGTSASRVYITMRVYIMHGAVSVHSRTRYLLLLLAY